MESVCSDTKWKSLYQKLHDVYVEALQKQTTCPNVQPTSNLLAQLISKENLNTLIINLFPGNEGYSVMLRGRNGLETETVRLPYEETELLDYIDAEKLPPLLVDLLDRAQADLFHSGCVIAEVRDYRRSTNNTYSIQYVLLQPSMHTLLCDINSMTSDAPNWTVEDKLALESQLLLHISEPLCLDPSPGVFLASARLNYEKHKLNTTAFRRCAKRCSQVALNRRRKMAMCSAPKHLKLFDFVMHRKNKIKNIPPVNLKLGLKPCVDPWKKTDVQLTTPETIEVQKYAKALDRPKLTGDNSPIVVEEYMFETERSQGRVNVARLVIMQRLSDECYLGSLYVDRDFKDADFKGSTCRFWLGTKANVEKYVRQFREIFTEEGRRQVKITHSIPGRQPTITYTQVLGSVASSTVASVPNVTPATVVASQASAVVSQPVIASSASVLVGEANPPLQHQPQQPRLSIGQSIVAQSSAVVVSSSVAVTTPSPTVVTNLAQLRLSLQQQQQLMRQKSASGLLPISSHHPVNMSGTVQLQSNGQIGSAFMSGINAVVVPGSASPGAVYVQGSNKTGAAQMPGSGQPGSIHIQGSGLVSSIQSTVRSPSGATIQHLAPPSLSRESSMQSASRNPWTNQNTTTTSLQLSTLNSVVPPNVNIGNIAGLSSSMSLQNVGRLHNANTVQGASTAQRTFIAMVTSQSVFNSPPQGLLSTVDSPFSLSIGSAGQQFVAAGGTVNTVRGVANEQLLISRSMQGISSTPRPPQMLQQSPGPIHIQTDMSPVGSQMMSPPSMSPFHSMTAGQSHLVHHQQMTSPVSAVPHQTLAGFQLQGARVVQPSSLMIQLPPSSGSAVGQLINRNRRPSNSKLP